MAQKVRRPPLSTTRAACANARPSPVQQVFPQLHVTVARGLGHPLYVRCDAARERKQLSVISTPQTFLRR